LKTYPPVVAEPIKSNIYLHTHPCLHSGTLYHLSTLCQACPDVFLYALLDLIFKTSVHNPHYQSHFTDEKDKENSLNITIVEKLGIVRQDKSKLKQQFC
jgi:hypothetical protein